MTATEKEHKINLINEDIAIFKNVAKENPNDTLSRDILSFKEQQLKDIMLTPTTEDLQDKELFNQILARQQEQVMSLKTQENKTIKNVVVLFNSGDSTFNVKYSIDEKEKQRTYKFDKKFLLEANKIHKKLSDKYGKDMSDEYDKIIYNVLYMLDEDLGTKYLTEFLNNNKTFNVLYDFRNVFSLKRKMKKVIKDSYNKNSSKSNIYLVKDDSEESNEIYQRILGLNKKEEEVEITPFTLDISEESENTEKIKEPEEDVEVLEETLKNNLNLSEILSDSFTEILQ